jgi:Histidine kinase
MKHPRKLPLEQDLIPPCIGPMQVQVRPSLRTLAARPSLAMQGQGAATMYQIPGVVSAAATTSAPAEPRVQPTRGPPPGSPPAPEDGNATGPAEAILDLVEDRERIALGLHDAVVRRLFTVGLDLQAALGIMGDHPASDKICHAVDEVDQAIRDTRDGVFDHLAGGRSPSTSTSTI